ncbi:hypothetical protein D7294_01175 [Streptomyces hoynatensis]|uniref:RNA polymerase subunit sigma-70 n=1 Tax=Streptomyces hoynatensis TaxID=1141874 RepID=A0A3A9ZHM2_9ACTN|nr:hypothetical protein D7294_01175 [Streptomyces hoynatensis]
MTRAFRLAWEQWPRVARDEDPAGWVRAAVHELALSPWYALLPRRRRARGAEPAPAGPPGDALLRAALLALPRCYRRTVVLHDGLGLPLPQTAAETEATCAATARRLRNAREALVDRVPRLAQAPPEARERLLAEQVRGLLAAAGGAGATRLPAAIRLASERWNARLARLAVLLALAGLAGLAFAWVLAWP